MTQLELVLRISREQESDPGGLSHRPGRSSSTSLVTATVKEGNRRIMNHVFVICGHGRGQPCGDCFGDVIILNLQVTHH